MFQAAYMAPSSLEETLGLLGDTSHLSMPIAGGTRLLVDLQEKAAEPALLVDLRHLDTLKQIRLRADVLQLGGLVTLAQIEREETIARFAPLLVEMAKCFGNPLIRVAATLGGNIASSHTQMADAVVPLLALDALLLLESWKGDGGCRRRTLTLDEYVRQGPVNGELITQIAVPVRPPDSYAFYYKLGNRKAGAAPIASAAVAITSHHRRVIDARIALGAVALTPLRARRAEAALLGEVLPLRVSSIDRCLDSLTEELPEPLDDIWASASYRAMMGKALVKKALGRAEP